MHAPKIRSLVVGMIVSVALLFGQTGPAYQQGLELPEGVHAVTTSEIEAVVSTEAGQERITGRVSFHLVITPQFANEGLVPVRGFNLAFFGVPQELLAGKAPVEDPLGVLGYSMAPAEVQMLEYDAQSGELRGQVKMFGDAAFLAAFAQPVEDGEGDLFQTPVLPATAEIRIRLAEPLDKVTVEPRQVAAEMSVQVVSDNMRIEDFEIPSIVVEFEQPAIVDVGPIFWFDVAQQLCVQPVRLLQFTVRHSPFGFPIPTIEYSGAGLPFGEPGARLQWSKADVVFNIREMKTVVSPQHWVLSEPEAGSLLSKVDDDDCVEVYFVNDFSPQALWGGGATFGCGLASTKIITSDGNARGGVDLTHLAHELGHAIALHHPGATPMETCVPASSGTLMCGSGYLNDNPKINSQENAQLLDNPLFKYVLTPIGPSPDCTDSADCGSCP